MQEKASSYRILQFGSYDAFAFNAGSSHVSSPLVL